jgi:CheY-like chemotaxis protein
MIPRILVVDDDRDHAESVADILELHGYAVEVAHSGEEAVERFTAVEFDVTVMDVKLPGMNGVEAFWRFRQLKPSAQVIMMTAFSLEQLVAEAIDGGAAGVLQKPFAAADLIAAVERVKPRGLVVVADDDAGFAESAAELLAGGGYAVEIARTGEEALAKLQRDRVDCLVLDLRLPLLSGLEVYLKLRDGGRLVPCVLVTGHPSEADAAAGAIDAGRLLVKPFDPPLLVHAVRHATEVQREF